MERERLVDNLDHICIFIDFLSSPLRRLFEERDLFLPSSCRICHFKGGGNSFPCILDEFFSVFEVAYLLQESTHSVRFLFVDPSFVKQIGVKSSTAGAAGLLFEPNLERHKEKLISKSTCRTSQQHL